MGARGRPARPRSVDAPDLRGDASTPRAGAPARAGRGDAVAHPAAGERGRGSFPPYLVLARPRDPAYGHDRALVGGLAHVSRDRAAAAAHGLARAATGERRANTAPAHRAA